MACVQLIKTNQVLNVLAVEDSKEHYVKKVSLGNPILQIDYTLQFDLNLYFVTCATCRNLRIVQSNFTKSKNSVTYKATRENYNFCIFNS